MGEYIISVSLTNRKNEFMRRFNKYGFGVVPATTVINNYDNE